MTNPDLERLRLAALHKHWGTADSINHHFRPSVNAGSEEAGLPEPMTQFAQLASAMAALTVWYALLYVVVEGYRELGCHDEEIDRLLGEGEHADALRCFRNATFHFQLEPLQPKLTTFLVAADSEKWIHSLNGAFRRFFEERLDLKEMFARVGWRATTGESTRDD